MRVTDPQVKSDLRRRLRRVEGQVRGVQRMIDEERDCHEILQQLSAVRSASYSTSVALVRSYAKQCLTDPEMDVPVEEFIDNVLDALGQVNKTTG
ncbi:MAG: Copper-sensing transcriptional repressor CsoR [Anaerolineales bacterium]|nr:Copper-sensing transcriptional repressor CsoR [Anaerolineales bacterium]